MSCDELFEYKAYFNKWLDELTASKKKLIIDMLNKSRSEGFNEGYNCAKKEFSIDD